jgi:hypothetical protein
MVNRCLKHTVNIRREEAQCGWVGMNDPPPGTSRSTISALMATGLIWALAWAACGLTAWPSAPARHE